MMDTPRDCGCKGCRTCLLCEKEYGIPKKTFQESIDPKDSYVYCPWCEKAWPGWDMNQYKEHPNHKGTPIKYPGVYIDLEFLSEDEEIRLMDGVDSIPWDPSQSGRRKQNYGPKCNFKKQKLRLGDFNGFPKFSQFIQDKLRQVPLLHAFQTIEQCSLEYDPTRGASIDPHIDDCWIWGERIVTVNLLSDSVLTMTLFNGSSSKYNLPCVQNYSQVSIGSDFTRALNDEVEITQRTVIRIPMPRRSLLVLFGDARYNWEHSVFRDDISERRVCIAYREFTPPYLHGGIHENKGSEVVQIAKTFWVT